ncbi:MAG: hypothetical protein LUG98_04670 [Tannerellaceae bacterium]|nr:hypothetical protein [Tannerellaceae bacterium]
MRKIVYYIVPVLLLLIACTRVDSTESIPEEGSIIRLGLPQPFRTRIVDEDNLASEQTIHTISVFLTDPSSDTFTHTYINTGFSTSGDYKLVSLPEEPADLGTKNIYVVTNYDDAATLEALSTLTDLKNLHTPEVNKSNNLDPLKGFCMYGSTLNFDFTSGTNALVEVERTCAKMRINLTFPENPTLSTNNSFLIQHAAGYTYIIENPTAVLPLSDYFNFAADLPLTDNGEQTYTNIVYVYQAPQPPVITLYTYINNSAEPQSYTADLPIPDRNYLYDIDIRVYEDTGSNTRTTSSLQPEYKYEYIVKTYNSQGELVEDYK